MRSHPLLWLAVLLLITWVVLRVALALTGAALHLLWIGACIFALIWVVRRFTGGGQPPAVR